MYRLRDLGFLRDVTDNQDRFIAFGEESYYGALVFAVSVRAVSVTARCTQGT
jgi:hypothetical protein